MAGGARGVLDTCTATGVFTLEFVNWKLEFHKNVQFRFVRLLSTGLSVMTCTVVLYVAFEHVANIFYYIVSDESKDFGTVVQGQRLELQGQGP